MGFSDQFAQPQVDGNTGIPIELTNATGTYLDHLNDHCLLEIFSRKSLTPMDLCALAETCKLFKRITQCVFPKKLTIHGHCSGYSITSKDFKKRIENGQNVERIFKRFGPCLVALSVYSAPIDLMNLITKHCDADTLRELEIEAMKITDLIAVELKPIFQQLRLLSIVKCTIECGANLFANCDSLVELRVNEQRRCKAILDNNFPSLQRFTFRNDNVLMAYDVDLLVKFCERHKTLQCIQLNTPTSNTVNVFLRNLGDACQELDELALKFEAEKLVVSSFPSLKRLRLYRYFYAAPPFVVQLPKLESLEALEIGGAFNCKEFMESLPLLNNLREFGLDIGSISENEKIPWTLLSQLTKVHLLNHVTGGRGHSVKRHNVVDIVRQLTKLEELDIDVKDFVLTEREFLEILDAVEGRSQVLTVKYGFRCRTLSYPNREETLKVKLMNNMSFDN